MIDTELLREEMDYYDALPAEWRDLAKEHGEDVIRLHFCGYSFEEAQAKCEEDQCQY